MSQTESVEQVKGMVAEVFREKKELVPTRVPPHPSPTHSLSPLLSPTEVPRSQETPPS